MENDRRKHHSRLQWVFSTGAHRIFLLDLKNLILFSISIFSAIIVSRDNNEPKKGISEEEIASTIKELCHLIMKSGDESFIYDFFNCLFTKPELKDIANRWLLVKEIDAGTTQREIANKFSMSLCKITRGSRELNKADSAFRKMLELLKNQ